MVMVMGGNKMNNWKDEQEEFGFIIRIKRPLSVITDDELADFDSDCDLLETEVERLRSLLTDEMKRRNW